VNDRELVAAVEGCTLGGADFHHADHVRLGWIYLNELPLLEGLKRFTTTLERFAAHHGAADKYHATITWAYLILIHERMHRAQDGDWESFRAANADLFAWRPSILERYYTRERLGSEEARRTFVLPDRLTA
jgi:hypothetical protein